MCFYLWRLLLWCASPFFLHFIIVLSFREHHLLLSIVHAFFFLSLSTKVVPQVVCVCVCAVEIIMITMIIWLIFPQGSEKVELMLQKGLMYTPQGTCEAPLHNRTSYVITGNVVANKPTITLCNFASPMRSLTPKMKKGFRLLYQSGCDCPVSNSRSNSGYCCCYWFCSTLSCVSCCSNGNSRIIFVVVVILR